MQSECYTLPLQGSCVREVAQLRLADLFPVILERPDFDYCGVHVRDFKSTWQAAKTPQQQNGDDCGVYTAGELSLRGQVSE